MKVDELWYAKSAGARAARALVAPLSWLFHPVVAVRNTLYDRRILHVHDSALPVVSVGNVTVGGTGKTPLAAHLVAELVAMGHRPAVVMRGYGDDEPELHARLNPGVIVVTNADRVAGIQSAAAKGADVVVMDDGFQHRRAERDLDIVLVSAERWSPDLRLLPAGPLREPLSSLGRADLIVVTQKSASNAAVAHAVAAIEAMASVHAPVITVSLSAGSIVSATGDATIPLDAIRGKRILAVAGIGDPASFFAQLRQLGADVTERQFRDHHAYSAEDVARLIVDSAGHKYVIITEKDAVKLAALWPAKCGTFWYLSQAVRLNEGASLIVTAALAKLFQRATSIA